MSKIASPKVDLRKETKEILIPDKIIIKENNSTLIVDTTLILPPSASVDISDTPLPTN